MIAKTLSGNNTIGIGLITHFTAILIAMIPLGGVDNVITYIYVTGSLLLSLGIFVELFDKQKNIFKNWHFYAASALSLLAFIGPLFSCWILYILSKGEKKSVGGFIASLFALKVHPIVLLIWTIAMGITLAILFQQHDPYFSH